MRENTSRTNFVLVIHSLIRAAAPRTTIKYDLCRVTLDGNVNSDKRATGFKQ